MGKKCFKQDKEVQMQQLKVIIDAQLDYQRNKLTNYLRNLGDHLLHLAICIKDDPGYPISSLGVVQSQGHVIDLTCAEIGVLKRVKDELPY